MIQSFGYLRITYCYGHERQRLRLLSIQYPGSIRITRCRAIGKILRLASGLGFESYLELITSSRSVAEILSHLEKHGFHLTLAARHWKERWLQEKKFEFAISAEAESYSALWNAWFEKSSRSALFHQERMLPFEFHR